MNNPDRTVIVDIIRGFALIGVLIANFTSYVDQQTPASVLDGISTSMDHYLMNFNTIFLEWKFMTLFSILFGYGFGLILLSLEHKNINPNSFFAKRMGWLFVFGIIHCLFWWGDVLNLYAMSGILLLLFKNKSTKTILYASLLCMLILPVLITYLIRNQPDTFTNDDMQGLYTIYKQGTLMEVWKFNVDFYYRMFVISGNNIHDIIESLGRFLFGYFLLRIGLFQSIETKKVLFKKITLCAAPLMVVYFMLKALQMKGHLEGNSYLMSPLMSVGILSTTTFYVSILAQIYLSFGMNAFFRALQALGRMTLTNYLMVSVFLIVLLYGFGFNQLGEIPMHIIWCYAFGWLIVEIAFSTFWLKHFRYGPMEWIWRQLTYGRRIALRK